MEGGGREGGKKGRKEGQRNAKPLAKDVDLTVTLKEVCEPNLTHTQCSHVSVLLEGAGAGLLIR